MGEPMSRFYNPVLMSRWALLIGFLAAPVWAFALQDAPRIPAGQERARITVSTLDRSFEAKKLEIKESGGALSLTVTEASGTVSTIPGPDVVEIGFGPVETIATPGPDDVEIVLRTGDRIVGALGDP